MNFDKIVGFFVHREMQTNEKALAEKKEQVKCEEKNYDESYNTLGEASRAQFLATQNIQNSNSEAQKPVSEEDKKYIKQNISDFYKDLLLNEVEIENAINAITIDATKKVAYERLIALKNLKNIALSEQIFLGKANSTFILDNAEKFEQIFNRENCRMMFADIYSLIEATDNEKTLNSLLKHSLDPIDFAANATSILYDTKEHNIKFGDEKVNIDSAFIINLLSEYQDWRGYEEFNKNVEKLTEKNHRNSDELNYYKLVEGILTQKPELYDIINLYTSYINLRCKDVDNETAIERCQNFFEELDLSGLLPKNIELRTIVPDNNALISPRRTCALMYEKGLC